MSQQIHAAFYEYESVAAYIIQTIMPFPKRVAYLHDILQENQDRLNYNYDESPDWYWRHHAGIRTQRRVKAKQRLLAKKQSPEAKNCLILKQSMIGKPVLN